MTEPRLRDRAVRGRARAVVAGLLALALCATLGLGAGDAAATPSGAQAKKKRSSVFTQTLAVNAAVPDDAAAGPSTPVRSTITVGKKFKGKVVGDLNVTGITTTGSGADAADDLGFRISAPSGRSVLLINPTGIGDVSIGPLTLDDDTPTIICNAPPPALCGWPLGELARPFAGTANLTFLGGGGTGGLSAFDGVSMKGSWTLTVWDEVDLGQTNTLNSWGLKITAAKPVKS